MRTLMLILALLLIPIVPFLLWGTELSDWVSRQLQEAGTAGVAATLVVGLLATDILLPVPSSMVATWAGARLGWLGGTMASLAGMTLGAIIGFALARWIGAPLLARSVSSAEQGRWSATAERWGPTFLIAARGLPVIAEASVLLAGVQRLPWIRFLPAILLSNFILALAYALLGELAREKEWLPAAIVASGAVPLGISVYLRRRAKRSEASR